MDSVIEELGLTHATTIASMVAAWRLAEQQITDAHRMLSEAESALRLAFDGPCQYMHIKHEELGCETIDGLIDDLKRRAWETIIEKINLRKIMSQSKQNELDAQIKSGDFPDITETNILAMLETNYNRMNEYAEEMIREVYEWVRPCKNEHRWGGEYKTNVKSAESGLGEKVIIAWAVERGYNRTGRPWRIGYSSEDKFTALDNVFHLLDGKGVVKTHHGPLYDAVAAAEVVGTFETEYFKGRCFTNRNMHLQFKRLDLLQEFNRVAAGMRLKSKNQTYV